MKKIVLSKIANGTELNDTKMISGKYFFTLYINVGYIKHISTSASSVNIIIKNNYITLKERRI
jgi:hypothetical protein